MALASTLGRQMARSSGKLAPLVAPQWQKPNTIVVRSWVSSLPTTYFLITVIIGHDLLENEGDS